ncbi:MAG: ABC transporter ATP-binding protein [Chloroflexi bacterium]|nr:MAG: ABC transporter ATP-binding protein [Chloroflexota bacterium]
MSSLTESKPLSGSEPGDIPEDTAILLDCVSICYRVPRERIGTFKEYAIRWLQRKVQMVDFWALHDVSLNVRRGEVMGIVGQNGAGKSTLLKLIARVIRPTSGRVVVKGRVAPLLELGAGFHPELSGRENVYLNGSMLGFSREEMDEKIGRIVDFAELHSFIEAPIRTYSSGMWARLGFAVATDTRPDILIVDEILSVGDESFQRKCMDRINSYRESGTTILLVSHTMGLIQDLCQRAAWLNHGHLMAFGEVDEVIREYRESQPH